MNDDMQMGEAMRLKAVMEDVILKVLQSYQKDTGLSIPAITLSHSRDASGLFTGAVSGVKVSVEF